MGEKNSTLPIERRLRFTVDFSSEIMQAVRELNEILQMFKEVNHQTRIYIWQKVSLKSQVRFTSGWMDQLWYIHTMEYYIPIKEKYWYLLQIWLNLENMLSERGQDIKGHIFYDSIYTEYPEL